MHVVFEAVRMVVARTSGTYSAKMSDAQSEALQQAFGEKLASTDNDGIVPSLSQVWGEVVRGVHADHLDVVGHFAPSAGQPGRIDIFASGSDFHEEAFEALWRGAARFISRSM